ncbi:MAG: XRE family transcriptional regulator [Eubacteriales bacterium]|nr:XRE family transcriptional regulator [Eubacteriales bacterium]
MEIGGKLRRLRQTCGLTLEELADRTELTKGFLSQVERDLTSPSLATLTDILTCLGTDLKEFFNDADDTDSVYTAADTFEKEDAEAGSHIRWLVPDCQTYGMEPILVTLRPDGGRLGPEEPHDGEEFGYVLSGTVVLLLGDSRQKVRRGESFYIDSSYRHGVVNEGKSQAQILWVSCPPSF